MAVDLLIHCSCGALRGAVRDASPRTGNRVVCYCDDCQAFAHFLRRADDILDQHGGTDIYQTSQGGVTFNAGANHLACVRLTSRGLHRWYAACCNTPIGNTLSSSTIPFVGLILRCLVPPGDDPSMDLTLGPARARAFRKFAQGSVSALAAGESMPRLMLRFGRLVIQWRLRGDQRRSPFFDARTGTPIVKPRVLTAAERAGVN
jgi:Family of unknown function (DUF6151)